MLNSIVDPSQNDQAHWDRDLVAKKLEEFEAHTFKAKLRPRGLPMWVFLEPLYYTGLVEKTIHKLRSIF